MLIMEYEFRRGFFFVRLSGNINKNNYFSFIEELDNIIEKTGLNKIVINIDNISKIDKKYINRLLKYIKCNTYKGILILICDNNTLINNDNILKICYEKEVYNYI